MSDRVIPKDKDPNVQYYLQHLTEECAEVIQAISKIKRFGLYDIYTRQGEAQVTNKEKFEQEVIQLQLLIILLKEEFGFTFNINTSVRKYFHGRWRDWKQYSEEVLK